MVNELTTIVQEQGLEPSKVEILLARFGTFFQEAKTIANEAKSIIVKDESEKELMHQARVKRLQLQEIRVAVNKTRIELKEQSLREGRAIDGIANVIKALVVPVEEHLEKQEQFAVLKEQARLEAQYSDRLEKLSQLTDTPTMYSIRDMNEVTFETLIVQLKRAKTAEAEAAKSLEADRVAAAEKARKEQEKMRVENEKLKKQQLEAQKKLNAERKKREEVESKLAAEQQEREEKRLAAIDAQNKALLAPDKEKLNSFIQKLTEGTPSFQNPKVSSYVANEMNHMLGNLKTFCEAL